MVKYSNKVYFNIDRLNIPKANHDVRVCMGRSVLVDGKQKDRFERKKEVEAERDFRVRHLARIAPMLRKDGCSDLAEKALHLRKRLQENAPTWANPVFYRRFRRRMTGALLEAAEGFEDRKAYTLVAPDWAVPPEDIMEMKPKLFVEQVRSQLNRAGIGKLMGFAVVAFDCEFDRRRGCFVPHIHAFVCGDKVQAFERLRELRRYASSVDVKHPIVRSEINDAPRQLAYLFKSFWPARDGGMTGLNGSLRLRRKARLEPRLQARALLVMDRTVFGEACWLHGCKIAEGRLIVGDLAG